MNVKGLHEHILHLVGVCTNEETLIQVIQLLENCNPTEAYPLSSFTIPSSYLEMDDDQLSCGFDEDAPPG